MMEKAGKDNSNNSGFQLWQQHNNPIELSTTILMHQKLDYLYNNTVTAGFVKSLKIGGTAVQRIIIPVKKE